jgi:pimeloyl-ACP methyl ester carboxylesterase
MLRPVFRWLACLGLLFAVGCASLVPYQEAITGLPASSFLLIGGQRVHVETAGQGEALVLVHGFGGSTYSWRHVLPRLSQEYRVIAVDLSGFGFSERPRDLRRYSRDGQIRLLLGLLDQMGLEKAHFMGHSYGGGIVASLALLHPERARSVILVDSTAPNYAIARRNNLAEITPLIYVFLRGYALRPAKIRKSLERSWFDDSQVTDEVVNAYLARLQIEGAARAYKGLTAPFETLEEEGELFLQDLTQPTLVVWGEEDRLILVEDGRLATSQIRQGRFVSIAECGHSPMEEKPEEFLATVLPFLRSLEDEP